MHSISTKDINDFIYSNFKSLSFNNFFNEQRIIMYFINKVQMVHQSLHQKRVPHRRKFTYHPFLSNNKQVGISWQFRFKYNSFLFFYPPRWGDLMRVKLHRTFLARYLYLFELFLSSWEKAHYLQPLNTPKFLLNFQLILQR